MGTKIQANSYLPEYRCLIDLDASTSNAYAMNEKWMLENSKNSVSLSSHDMGKVRQTILAHESTFRFQLRELHRLHGRQQELMNEIKRGGINKDDVLFSPFSTEKAKRPHNSCHSSSPHSFAGCLPMPTQDKRSLSNYETRVVKNSSFFNGTYTLGFPADSYFSNMEKDVQERDDKLSLSLFNKSSYHGEMSISKTTDGILDRLVLSKSDISSNSGSNLVTKDFFNDSLDRVNKEGRLSTLGLRNETSGIEHSSYEYAEKWRIDKHYSAGVALPRSLSAELKNKYSNQPLDIGTSLSRKKKKIFGVEISEGNDDAFDLASNMSINLHNVASSSEENHRIRAFESSSLVADTNRQMLSSNSGKNKAAEDLKKELEHSQKFRHPILADCHRKQDCSIGSLPWFLRNDRVSGNLKNGMKSSYFMNLDSLQNCSQKFFVKPESPHNTLHNSKPKREFEFQINDDLPTSDVLQSFKGRTSVDLRHCIDLNLSLDEEGASSAPSLPSAVVTIATAEIDLEAPAIDSEVELDSRKQNVLSRNSQSSYQECDKIAAEAMIAISLSMEKELVDEFNSLKWFAEVVSSTDDSRIYEVEESIPDGMDYFEFMTLKLEDNKQEQHYPEPFVLKTPSDDEAGAALTRRTRRGQSRRGRQRRDFQRDILPGLVTLSRLEVTEDFQAFEEMLKAGNGTWESGLSHRASTRNGRGRKRSGAALMKTPCSTEAQQPVCQIEERSLAEWGKKTRRVPRQRCPNAFLSFPVKC